MGAGASKKVPKMPKVMVSLRSIFFINAGYFQHKNQ
jgi:hypothetical protein